MNLGYTYVPFGRAMRIARPIEGWLARCGIHMKHTSAHPERFIDLRSSQLGLSGEKKSVLNDAY